MKILAISGSGRQASTNTAMLRTIAAIACGQHEVTVDSDLARLPVFTPDREGDALPAEVLRFADLIRAHDALIIASPEYVRAIPGGLKNAIDWLVSREELVGKPMALAHASHRGNDMLAQLRLVLSTVSDGFSPGNFLRIDLINMTPEQIDARLRLPENTQAIHAFLAALYQQVAASTAVG
ncbi:NADPH-dependent FMN reductase [Novosphingobium terrae]|uniref:NADPH-dependent FMN reductase n=1 Tax=Novosphingobium terrae TaxID=2726189 RepID=UPI00197E5543|nr:NADPH-dependent FMN reductase [Novosphingobium terrae]